jgi:hypothetical protein
MSKPSALGTWPQLPEGCQCYNCLDDPSLGFRNPAIMMMVLCPTCSNKRCPHSDDHNLACTGSNEPGQPGSRYGGLDIPDPLPCPPDDEPPEAA